MIIRTYTLRSLLSYSTFDFILTNPAKLSITQTSPSFSANFSSEMELTALQLKQFDGSDPSKPIYVAIKGRIFDVSTGKNFYGPGGSYCMFAGKDASRALGKMTKNEEDVCASLDGLTEKEMGVLDDWEKKFEAKYPVVGSVI